MLLNRLVISWGDWSGTPATSHALGSGANNHGSIGRGSAAAAAGEAGEDAPSPKKRGRPLGSSNSPGYQVRKSDRPVKVPTKMAQGVTGQFDEGEMDEQYEEEEAGGGSPHGRGGGNSGPSSSRPPSVSEACVRHFAHVVLKHSLNSGSFIDGVMFVESVSRYEVIHY